MKIFLAIKGDNMKKIFLNALLIAMCLFNVNCSTKVMDNRYDNDKKYASTADNCVKIMLLITPKTLENSGLATQVENAFEEVYNKSEEYCLLNNSNIPLEKMASLNKDVDYSYWKSKGVDLLIYDYEKEILDEKLVLLVPFADIKNKTRHRLSMYCEYPSCSDGAKNIAQGIYYYLKQYIPQKQKEEELRKQEQKRVQDLKNKEEKKKKEIQGKLFKNLKNDTKK